MPVQIGLKKGFELEEKDYDNYTSVIDGLKKFKDIDPALNLNKNLELPV